MKKIYLSFLSFVFVIFLSANVKAEELQTVTETVGYDAPKDLVIPTSKTRSTISIKSNSGLPTPDYHLTNTIAKKGNVYSINGRKVTLSSESVLSGDNLKFVYTESYLRLESYYKKVAPNKYAHVRSVQYYVDRGVKMMSDFTFYYDANRCNTSTNEIVAGNCTRYDQSSSKIILKSFVGTSNKVASQNIVYYPAGSRMYLDYTSNDLYKNVNNRLIRYKRIEAPRKSNGYLARVSEIDYHNNGRVSKNLTYGDLGYSRTVASFIFKNRTITNYNVSGKMTAKTVIYNMQKYAKGKFVKYYATTHKEARSYYGNGRVKQVLLHKRNKTNVLTQSRKNVYHSNGKKYTYKLRTYRAGRAAKQTFYRYNAKGTVKGGAYRIVTTYNKKGKATKALRANYNKKGKLAKAKSVKLTKAVVNF